VKDRVLAHNPLGAIYSKYYQNKLKNGIWIKLKMTKDVQFHNSILIRFIH
jgi:hypothetical protein